MPAPPLYFGVAGATRFVGILAAIGVEKGW